MSSEIILRSDESEDTTVIKKRSNKRDLPVPEDRSILDVSPFVVKEDVYSNRIMPGQIEATEQGRLLRKYILNDGYVRFSQKLFDNFIDEIIPNIYSLFKYEYSDDNNKKHILYIDKNTIRSYHPEKGGIKITPQEARNKHRTYELKFRGHMVHIAETNKKRDKTDKKVEVGYEGLSERQRGLIRAPEGYRIVDTKEVELPAVPIMLGSASCLTSEASEDQNVAAGECRFDVKGYFIIKGKSKVLIYQNMARTNRISTIVNRVTGRPTTSITVESPSSTDKIAVEYSYKQKYKYIIGKEVENVIMLSLSRFNVDRKEFPFGLSLPAFSLLGYLLVQLAKQGIDMINYDSWSENEEEQNGQYVIAAIINLLKLFIEDDAEWPRIYRSVANSLLMTRVFKYKKVVETVLSNINIPFKKSQERQKKGDVEVEPFTRRDVFRRIDEALFPNFDLMADEYYAFNIGGSTQTITLLHKIQMMAYMIVVMVRTDLGLKAYDDRDMLGNKIFKSAPTTLKNRYYRLALKTNRTLAKELDKRLGKNQTEAILDAISGFFKVQVDQFNKAVLQSFTSNYWNLGYRAYIAKHISEQLDYSSSNVQLSHLMKTAPMVDKRIRSAIRYPSSSQMYYICFFQTPEGGNCGLINYFAITCQLSQNKLNNDYELMLFREIAGELVGNKTGDVTLERSEQVDVSSIIAINPCMLNGKLIGWCDGVRLKEKLLKLRLTDTVNFYDLCVVLDDGVLWVDSSPDRPIRPLLRVNPKSGRLFIDEDDAWELPYDDLLKGGYIEFLDAWMLEPKDMLVAAVKSDLDDARLRLNNLLNERDKILVQYRETLALIEPTQDVDVEGVCAATDLESDRGGLSAQEAQTRLERFGDRKSRLEQELEYYNRSIQESELFTKYTHCEIHPSALAGHTAAAIPFANTNAAARNTFACNMKNGAITQVHTNFLSVVESSLKVAVSAQQPLVNTIHGEMREEIESNENVPTILASFFGFNEEDAGIVSKSYIDRGGHMYVKLTKYDSAILNSKAFSEFYANPADPQYNIRSAMAKPMRYRGVDSNGFPILEHYFAEYECLVGKVRKVSSPDGTEIYEDASLYVNKSEGGRAIDVFYSAEGEVKYIEVLLMQVDSLTIGDKLFHSSGQKFTVGRIVSDEDMPFVEGGIIYYTYKDENGKTVTKRRPEINNVSVIMNPHAMARMTIGLILDLFCGNAGAMAGIRIAADAFQEANIGRVTRMLHEFGQNTVGTSNVVNPITGEVVETPINLGITGIKVSKHGPSTKHQDRGKFGAKNKDNQPAGGRTKAGGLKFGNMELAGLLGHDVRALIKDIYSLQSDYIEVAVCKQCGTISKPNTANDSFLCPKCKNAGEYLKLGTSYSYPQYSHIFFANGFMVKASYKKV